jgi:hypothetical protein
MSGFALSEAGAAISMTFSQNWSDQNRYAVLIRCLQAYSSSPSQLPEIEI